MATGNGKSKSTAVAVKTPAGVIPFDATKFKAASANTRRASTGTVSFLRMDKAGDWYYGVDDIPANDAIGYVDPMGSVHGWQCWADTSVKGVSPEVLGSHIVPNYEDMPPRPATVPPKGREWAETHGMSILVNGAPLTYTVSSKGGIGAIVKLNEARDEQYAEVGDDGPLFAKVRLTCDFYMHKQYGKTFYPVFEVLGWATAEEAVAASFPVAKKAGKLPPPPAKKSPAKTRRAA